MVRALAASDYAAGEHVILWDGRDDQGNPVAGGVYFYRLEAAGFTATRKMILVR